MKDYEKDYYKSVASIIALWVLISAVAYLMLAPWLIGVLLGLFGVSITYWQSVAVGFVISLIVGLFK